MTIVAMARRKFNLRPHDPLGLFTVSKDGAIGALDVNTGDVLIKKPEAHEYESLGCEKFDLSILAPLTCS